MNKKVLLVIPNLGLGGAQKVFYQQLTNLAPHFEVSACVFNWDNSFQSDQTKGIISLDVPAGKSYLGKMYCFFLRVIRLRALKNRLGINLTISHLEGADYVNVLSKKNDKIICWIHGTKKFDENISGLLGIIRSHLLMPLLYRRANKIVTVSVGILHELKNTYSALESKLEVVQNGFDISLIQKRALDNVEDKFLEICNRSKVIITHGRLSKQKNLSALIRIYAEVIKSLPVKLVIIGDGDLRNQILNESSLARLRVWSIWNSQQLSESFDIYFFGQQNNPFRYLRHASIYVMTSGWEGFPLALCEAMVCKLPVLTSDCYTGPREIIAPELSMSQPVNNPVYASHGILMPLVDHQNQSVITMWSSTVQNILKDEELIHRYKNVGIERIKEFDTEKTLRKTLTIINQLIV